MSEPFIGEIRIFSFDFPPKGWMICAGQLLGISQNAALFSILGTSFGGNGTTNFALPDLRGRTPIHWGQGPGLSNYVLGETAGEETHTLITSEIPTHTHAVTASSNTADVANPASAYWADGGVTAYSGTTSTALAPLGTAGGSTAHENRSPYLALKICIAIVGIFPSRN